MSFVISCQAGQRHALLHSLDTHFQGKGINEVDDARTNIEELLSDAGIVDNETNRRCVSRMLNLIHADKSAEYDLRHNPLDPNSHKKDLSGKVTSDLTKEVKNLIDHKTIMKDVMRSAQNLCETATTAWPVLLTIALLTTAVATKFWIAFGCVLALGVVMWVVAVAAGVWKLVDNYRAHNFNHELCVLNVNDPVSKKEQLFSIFCDRVIPTFKNQPEVLNSDRVHNLFNDWRNAQKKAKADYYVKA